MLEMVPFLTFWTLLLGCKNGKNHNRSINNGRLGRIIEVVLSVLFIIFRYPTNYFWIPPSNLPLQHSQGLQVQIPYIIFTTYL